MMAVFSPLAGRLSDRIEPRVVASAGMGLTGFGLCLFVFIGQATPLRSIVAGLLLLGFGFALFSSPNTNAVMGAVERKHYGVAASLLGTMRLTGQMLSMGVALMIFAVFLGQAQIGPENSPLFLKAVRAAFLVFAGLCLAGIFASLAR
jgi:MFS family permease